jgi:lipopolysaccharide export LptBFGC system permease protein LptF
MKTLHRHILSLAFARWAMVLFIGLFLILLGDFIGNIGRYLEALEKGRGEHVLFYFVLRFPGFLAAWLPVSAAAAALLTAWPMLRQGTLVALCAAGIPVRRVYGSLLGLSIAIGLLGFVLQDQAIPRLDPEAKLAKAVMLGGLKSGETVTRTVGWHDGGHFWCAQYARPEEGLYENIAVFSSLTNNRRNAILIADKLQWKNNAWEVTRPVLLNDDIQPAVTAQQTTLAALGLHLQTDAATLIERLKQDKNRTSDQLLNVHAENAWGYILLRISFGLLPLLCLIFALPSFLRLEGRHNLGNALGRAFMWMVIPIVGYWVLSRILVSNSTYVFTGTAIVLGGLLISGGWRWWMMRL